VDKNCALFAQVHNSFGRFFCMSLSHPAHNLALLCSHFLSGVTFTFLLRRQKKSNKRKGDFWRIAPPAKKGSTLLRPASMIFMTLYAAYPCSHLISSSVPAFIVD